MKISKFFRKSDRKFTNEDACYLFYELLQNVPNNWKDIDGNTIVMDFLTSTNWKYLEREYFHNYSPDKESSILLDEIYVDEDFVEDNGYKAEIKNLSDDIWMKFGEGWCRTWYAYKEKYRPLDNYNGNEKTTYNDYQRESTIDNWDTDKIDNSSEETNNNYFGVNSGSTGSPAGKGTTTTTPSNSLTGRFTQPNGNHEIREGSQHHLDKQTGSIEINKNGNLGLTTPQQMLTSEINFRTNYNFYRLMFDNIDDILTCKTYGGGC